MNNVYEDIEKITSLSKCLGLPVDDLKLVQEESRQTPPSSKHVNMDGTSLREAFKQKKNKKCGFNPHFFYPPIMKIQ